MAYAVTGLIHFWGRITENHAAIKYICADFTLKKTFSTVASAVQTVRLYNKITPHAETLLRFRNVIF